MTDTETSGMPAEGEASPEALSIARQARREIALEERAQRLRDLERAHPGKQRGLLIVGAGLLLFGVLASVLLEDAWFLLLYGIATVLVTVFSWIMTRARVGQARAERELIEEVLDLRSAVRGDAPREAIAR